MTVRLENGNTINNKWIEMAKGLFHKVYVDHDRVRVYPTSWEYEEAEIFRDEASLIEYCMDEIRYLKDMGFYVTPEQPETVLDLWDILDYRQRCGTESAKDLLLLCGPDGFDGNYDIAEEVLEAFAKNEAKLFEA